MTFFPLKIYSLSVLSNKQVLAIVQNYKIYIN